MRDRNEAESAVHMSGPLARRLAPAFTVVAVLLAQCAASPPEANRQGSKEAPASGVCKEGAGSGPTEVVRALFRDYPFESTKSPEMEPLEVLLKYFDDKLAALFVKDRECTEKTGELCKISVTVIYGAQDADIKDLRFCEPAPRSDWVEARFLNFGKPQVVFFQVKKTPRGWRVSDVRYDADGSLVRVLSDP